MFWHAAIKGQKEAEQTIHQGCRPHMPQLMGIPIIQLVGLETTREELLYIYLEVYKLHRLPGSLPGEPAIWKEIMAKVPDHPHGEEDQTHEATVQSCPRDSHSSRSRGPHRRNNDSVGQTLATVQEAHQKALAAVSTLEREIEGLHHTWAWPQSRARSKNRDCHRPSGEGWKRRHCQVRFADEPSPSQSTDPQMPLGGEGSKGTGSALEEPPELKPTVASFLRGSPETLHEEGKKMPLEPDIMDFSQWVPWKAERCETPDWWEEMLAVLVKEDARKLTREVRASFVLPVIVGIWLKGGHSPGSCCTTMPLKKEVYAPIQLNLCMQGHLRGPKGKSSGICQGPPALGWAEQTAC